ncbi:MAG: glycosyltransferase [Acidimicrobiia bacterium]|nr:glycosyltransferase [Acidimicrobiia bacterium]
MLVSAAIIVRDEAEHLDACLTSLEGLVDEIVVVDTGSRDDSVAVARRHGAVLGHEPWQDDFSTPRNRSLDLASGAWILYIDADERVRRGDHAAVRRQLAAATDHVAFRVRFVPRVGWTPYRELRLWRHRPDIRFVGTMHESMLPAIEQVAWRDALKVGALDSLGDEHGVPADLTIEHLGFEGDLSHKYARNEPMLLAALEVDPERVYFYDHLARVYEGLGDDERARVTWRRGMDVVRARATDHPDDRLLWVNMLVHVTARDDPDGDLAALVEETHTRFPGNPAAEFATAAHKLSTGDALMAARRFEHLVGLDLDAIIATGGAYDERIFGEWAWNAIGLCRFALGDYPGAVDAFTRAEAADPDNEAYRTRRRLAEARAAPVSGR